MRIGIIGLGSIGKRHARCLLALGITDLVALRSGYTSAQQSEPDLQSVTQVYTEEEFYALQPDAVLVANPTSLHISAMLPALHRGLPVFVEKPISDHITAAQLSMLQQHRHLIVVGYCMRFLPAVSQIREFLASGRLGRFVKASFTRSYYLPYWHPYADYRTEYAARKSLGGGVIRTLSHELDLMHHLFGKAVSVAGAVDTVSDLELDVDDTASFSCKLESGARVNFDLDFLSPVNISTAEIFGTKGRLSYNFQVKQLRFYPYAGEAENLADSRSFDLEEMYLAQMQDFVQFAATGKSGNCRLDEALQVLRVIEAVEQTKPVRL